MTDNETTAKRIAREFVACPFCENAVPADWCDHGDAFRCQCRRCGVSLSGWCGTEAEALALHGERAALLRREKP